MNICVSSSTLFFDLFFQPGYEILTDQLALCPDSLGLTEEQCDDVWDNRTESEYLGLELSPFAPIDTYVRKSWDSEDYVPCGCVLWLKNDGESYALRYNRADTEIPNFNCAANKNDRAQLICKNWAW